MARRRRARITWILDGELEVTLAGRGGWGAGPLARTPGHPPLQNPAAEMAPRQHLPPIGGSSSGALFLRLGLTGTAGGRKAAVQTSHRSGLY